VVMIDAWPRRSFTNPPTVADTRDVYVFLRQPLGMTRLYRSCNASTGHLLVARGHADRPVRSVFQKVALAV